MTGIEQIGSVVAASASSGAASSPAVNYNNELPDLPLIGVHASDLPKSISNDFTQVLETYRAKSERVDNAVTQARGGEANGPPNQREMIRQLADLYTYAVDTQLLVRTAGQLTTGVRQLVTGQ
jgi:1-aminocyclopropane-1-carboxylate deaminase/D-cysteine desulfhydrase-like pyridoxal-dependent ACC family enzyme